ncbi:hypothetical protein [Laribacter hongkongensis]|nr:hypothetical protein [Laribacter hongkongensis]MCG8991107.1 hypothetical protein [Laribacter hongkongensis]MCG9006159.1 hypothetical protein [Laribacter hongkongensis]MCG9016534.1 hypothetical protein [Laribacter hongkongensis]
MLIQAGLDQRLESRGIPGIQMFTVNRNQYARSVVERSDVKLHVISP